MAKIRKGDLVKIMVGKDAGKVGKVLRLFTSKNKVLVEGANLSKRHVKKMETVEGGILDLPKPVSLSNVMLLCPNCKKETRVSFKLTGKVKVRNCKKCQKPIDSKGEK